MRRGRDFACLSAVSLLLQAGCATGWERRPDLPVTEQTTVHVRSTPVAEVLLEGRRFGKTPVDVPVPYLRFDERYERRVTLWQSNPGLAIAVSVLSLGIYLPFSLIPVDHQERLETGRRLEGAAVTIALEADGYETWHERIEVQGTPAYTIDVELRRQTAKRK
jgi:hypothetical protein